MTAPVRRVVLGADAWAVLLAAAPGLVLPPPFDAAGSLTAEQADAAEGALRSSAAVRGASGVLVADLHPSVRASLLLHLTADVALTVAVGDRTARFAVTRGLAGGLDRTRLGPVTLLTLLPEAVAPAAAALLPGLDEGRSGREVLRLEAATAVAAAQALAGGRPDLAAALAGPSVPPALGPVTGAGRLEVAGPDGCLLLLALRTPDGWRSARLGGDDLVLRPLDPDVLVTDLAGALGAGLVPA